VDGTGDGRVNLFDLVLVGSNYGARGPVDWLASEARSAEAPLAEWPPLQDVPRKEYGPDGGVPVKLVTRQEADGHLAVDVVAGPLDALFGADITLEVDPGAVRVLDTSTRPGIQVLPGAAWEADDRAFVAVNRVAREAREVRFAASRSAPAGPLAGDVVLATLELTGTTGQSDAAVALTAVELLDRDARPIPARWSGVDRTRMWTAHVPFVLRGVWR